MSAQVVTSKPTTFEIDGDNRIFKTVTTQENNDIKKTVYLQKIDKKIYDERKLTNPTLVTESDGLYYTTVRTEIKDKDGNVTGTDSIYADLSFQKAFDKKGKNALQTKLQTGSAEALGDNTDQPTSYWQKIISPIKDVQSALDSVNFSSTSVPLSITTENRRRKYDILYYPENIRKSKQDKIIFGMRYISGKRDISFNVDNVNPLSVGKIKTQTITGSVTLPIPGGISDKNSVRFGGETLDIGKALGAGAILNPTSAAQAVGNLLQNAISMSPDELQNALKSDQAENIVSALRLGLAQSFTGGNLISRLGGGVLNPNMELLFQAPTLRSFSFSFTMSARSRTEATQIKKIIRFFKQGMSVKKSADNIFVISPNIFTINYKTGDGREHPSIGRIKNCALVELNTSYGNGNTYMTFNDLDRTMTQYKIDMSFQELDPITEDDYFSNTGPLADPDEAFRVDPNTNAFPGEIGY